MRISLAGCTSTGLMRGLCCCTSNVILLNWLLLSTGDFKVSKLQPTKKDTPISNIIPVVSECKNGIKAVQGRIIFLAIYKTEFKMQ